MDAICFEPEQSATIPESGVLFEYLEYHHCRFPYGDELPYLFCGKDRFKNSSYCLQHSLICEVVR